MKKQVLLSVIFSSFVLLLISYFNIQVLNFSNWDPKAKSNSLRKINIFAPRGIIYDSNNTVMVENQTIYDLSIVPFDAQEDFDYVMLSNIIDMELNDIKDKVMISNFNNVTKFHPQIIKRNLDFKTVSKIEEFRLDMPGIIFNEFPARAYQKNSRSTHIIGYLSDATNRLKSQFNYIDGDVYGISGIERIYESQLRGSNGVDFHLFDSYGIDQGKYLSMDSVSPTAGNPLYLTVNNNLQTHIEKLLLNRIGSIICVNPINGDVLAMASGPDYDLRSFIGPVPIQTWNELANDTINKPLVNRSIGGIYPPGSIYKIIAIAAALEEKTIEKTDSIYCTGKYKFGNRFFNCWKEDGHGFINMYDAVKFSCNSYFYNLASNGYLEFDKWYDLGLKFGFGNRTGIDLIGESIGNVPKNIPRNQRGQYLNYIIGQGDVLATPIQIVSLMSILANKGKLCKPHINKNINSTDELTNINPLIIKDINQMIRRVISDSDGTGHSVNIGGYDIYGKTGTAENNKEPHSWFSGFINVDGKSMSLVVLIENGGKGSEMAAPIAKSIFQFYIDNLL